MEAMKYMRSLIFITPVLLCVLAFQEAGFAAPVFSCHTTSPNPSAGEDTLRDRALTLVKKHMEDLKKIKTHKIDFKAGFILPNPTIPCDYCSDERGIKLDDYVLDVSERYTDFSFEYELIDTYDDIPVVTNQKGDYVVTVQVKKTVRGLLGPDNTVNPKKSKTTYLVYLMGLNYNRQSFGISSLIAKRAPGTNVWMMELNPNLRISAFDFSSQDVFAPSSSFSTLSKVGVVRYFNPLKGVNAANLWFKVGLRANIYWSELRADFSDFVEEKIHLKDGTEGNPHHIDIKYNFSNIEEKQWAVHLEIPIGFSKRFELGNSNELSVEVEVSYSLPIYQKSSGSFSLDRLGTNHYFNKDIQSASGGAPVVYDSSPQSLQTTEGEIIDFFKDRSQNMNIDDSEKNGYLTFSFRPGILIKKYEMLKYHIGLNIGYAMMNHSYTNINPSYFNAPDDAPVLPLHHLDEASGHLFGGIVFGIKF